jgi:hypothetical protein
VLPAVLLQVGALPGEVDEVEEGHPAEADVEERMRRTRFDVLVHGLVGALLYVCHNSTNLGEHRTPLSTTTTNSNTNRAWDNPLIYHDNLVLSP